MVDIPKRTTPARGTVCVSASLSDLIYMNTSSLINYKSTQLSLSVPTLGYELLFQPEVVRVYTSLLKESQNPSVLEAAAGAIQNLCAGRWTVSIISFQ